MTNTVSRIISDDTLSRAVQIESAGNAKARAVTSSATGLFQFLDATWRDTVRKHRPDWLTGNTDAGLLAMRLDPVRSIEIGARFWEDNARIVGPGWTDGDLYLAHFAGPGRRHESFSAHIPMHPAQPYSVLLQSQPIAPALPEIDKAKIVDELRTLAVHELSG